MRTHLFRGVCAVAVVLALTASAFAQSARARQGAGCTGQARRRGDHRLRGRRHQPQDADEHRQEGRVPSGRSGVRPLQGHGVQGRRRHVPSRRPPCGRARTTRSSFARAGRAAVSAGDKAAAQKMQALAGEASAALRARQQRRGDREVHRSSPRRCRRARDCYYNIGVAQSNKKDYAAAEAAYKKRSRCKPDNGDAYTASPRDNQQKKFDLAAEASANAAKLHRPVVAAATPRPPTTRA